MGLSLAAHMLRKSSVVLVVLEVETMARIHEHGIRVFVDGEPISYPRNPLLVKRIADLREFDDIDLVFIATKTSAIHSVCEELKPAISKHSTVVSYQNGFNPGREIIDTLNTNEVLRMVLNYGAIMDEERDVHIVFSEPPHFIGALRGELYGLCRSLARLLTECGLHTDFEEDIERVIWEKSLLNAAMSPVCALTHTTMREAMQAPARMLVSQLLAEGIEVAKCEGIELPDDYHKAGMEYMDTAGDHIPSMVMDIDRHTQTEITQLNTQIIELGKTHGTDTTVNEMIVSLIDTIDLKAMYPNARRMRGSGNA